MHVFIHLVWILLRVCLEQKFSCGNLKSRLCLTHRNLSNYYDTHLDSSSHLPSASFANDDDLDRRFAASFQFGEGRKEMTPAMMTTKELEQETRQRRCHGACMREARAAFGRRERLRKQTATCPSSLPLDILPI